MPYYRVTEEATIEGAKRAEGFVLVLDEKRAKHYASVLELTEAPVATAEAEPATEPPLIRTLQPALPPAPEPAIAPEATQPLEEPHDESHS